MSKSYENRKQQARELRATHFELGHDDVSKANSEYIHKYKEWEARQEDNVGDKLGLKKSHFVLGVDGMKDPYKSLYKRDHVQFDKIAAATLDSETLKDLRRHHFELGTDKGLPKSEAQENFVPLKLPTGTKEEFDLIKERNKGQKLNFGDDADYFSSVYNEKHNKNLDPNSPHKGIDRAELKKQVQELQASNIILGSGDDDYGTSMRNAFMSKHGQYEKAAPLINLMQTNFVPGDDPQPTESMYKHFHKGHPVEKVTQNDALRSDLQSHHFVLGDKDVKYESTASGHFKEPGAESYKAKDGNPLLYKNHFVMGDSRPNYQTSYNIVHQEFPVQGVSRANDSLRDRTSNIVLGYAQPNLKSETHSKYVPYQDAKKAQLDERLSKDLRQSHFNFDGTTTYESYSHAMHKDVLDKAKEINPKGIMKDLANDLRKNHFDYGTDKNRFTTSQRDAYQGLTGKQSQLERELMNDLRKNHFDVGTTNNVMKETTYRTNYNWKDPTND